MTVFRSFFLAGIVLFFAAQQALCACAVPQTPAPAAFGMDRAMPTGMHHGQTCDETEAPAHDKSSCPHCSNDAQLIAQAAKAAPMPVLPLGAPPALFLVSAAQPWQAAPAPPPRLAPYQAAGPPRQTPFQLRTRLLN